MPPLRIALLQQPLVWHDARGEPRALRGRCCCRSRAAPTWWCCRRPSPPASACRWRQLAEPPGGPTTQWLLRLARSVDAAVTGSVITVEDGRYYNRLLWAQPDGTLRHYDKRHLFRMGREHEHFTAGRGAWSVPWRGWRVCPLVCYDLRFPVFSRRRPQLDYELLAVRGQLAGAARRGLATAAAGARHREPGVRRRREPGRHRRSGRGLRRRQRGGRLSRSARSHRAVPSAAVLTAVLDGGALAAFRARFPAHLDADRFTLEP